MGAEGLEFGEAGKHFVGTSYENVMSYRFLV